MLSFCVWKFQKQGLVLRKLQVEPTLKRRESTAQAGNTGLIWPSHPNGQMEQHRRAWRFLDIKRRRAHERIGRSPMMNRE
jgi:hypothetical protein